MVTYSIKRDECAYAPSVDMLYVVLPGGSLEYASEIEDFWDIGVSVFHKYPDGGLGGIEIYDFKERYGEPPLSIDIPAREPFKLEIPFALA